MPLYEFRCTECGQVLERIAPIGGGAVHCGKEATRLMSAPFPPIWGMSAADYALDSLNGDGHKNGLSPREKGKGIEKGIMKGLERNRPQVYSGFG